MTNKCQTCGSTATIDDGSACAQCGCDRDANERLALTPCSQLVVMRAVFETITKEMTAMERIESKAAEDRHWSMADAMKNKRLAYDSALGFAMRGIEQAFSSANSQADQP